MFNKNKGIIALFPAIIISSILLILCVSVSQSFLALLYRTTIFDEKSQSAIIAHSCLLRVLAKNNQNSNYSGVESLGIGDIKCDVGSFSDTIGSVSVKIGDAVSVDSITH